ncbi:hypothetical protein ACFX15_000974 [Malus domestica]
MEAAGGDHHHQEEVMILGCKEQHNNNNNIMKGKRTKRLRPQSPIPFAIPRNSSSPEGGVGGRGGGDGGENNNDCINSTNLSPTTSAELFQDSTTSEEEDMANCLILLAQGQSRAASSSPDHHHQPHHDHITTSSRRFLEATTAPAGKVAGAAGYYVYECKTCNRTFPSFQALGGHRASHKKPKANIGGDHKNKHVGIGLLPPSDEDQDTQLFKNNIFHNNNIKTSSSPLSLHLSNRGLVLSSNKSSSKIHECSICSAEFTSGQALGGHMRRHRAPTGATNTTLSLTPPPVSEAFESHQQQQQQQPQLPMKKQKSMLNLDLDLNLPASSEDDHHRETKFVFASKQQQQEQQQQERLRTQILVDCHY